MTTSKKHDQSDVEAAKQRSNLQCEERKKKRGTSKMTKRGVQSKGSSSRGCEDPSFISDATPGAVHMQDERHVSFISQKTRGLSTGSGGRIGSSSGSGRISGVVSGATEGRQESSFVSEKGRRRSRRRTGGVVSGATEGRRESTLVSEKGRRRSSRRTGGVISGATEGRRESTLVSEKGRLRSSRRTSGVVSGATEGRRESTLVSQKARRGAVSGATEGRQESSFVSQKGRGRTSVNRRTHTEESEDNVDDVSLESYEVPGARYIRDVVNEDNEDDTSQPGLKGRDAATGAEHTPEIEVATAQVVDEEALELEFTRKKSEVIRSQILSNAAVAIEVTTEKTLYQKYCASCGCTLVAILVLSIVLWITLSKEKEPEPLVGYEYLLDLLSPISETDILLNETTAQFNALNWLAFEDTAGIPLTESNSEFLASSLVERYVLALLYFSTGETNWTSSYDFLTNTSVCEWPSSVTNDNETIFVGVRCNEEGFVDSISLESNNMRGNIPSEVWALRSLQTLILSNNGLRGSLPPALGHMPNLRQLYLDRNALTGVIPTSFGGLRGLETLSLWRNFLQGTVPKAVTSLARLEEILMGDNFFTGLIPDFLPRGPIRRIKIGYNLFEGAIPDTLYQLSSLEELRLENNNLEGMLSSKIGNLVSLKDISLWRNNFGGALPSQIGNMNDLKILDVGTNRFESEIPTEFGELGRLEELVLSENALTGTIPAEFQQLSNLWNLDLSSNLLSGYVPSELGGLLSLRNGVVIFLHNNSLTGSLDSVFCEDVNGLPPPLTLTADCGEIDCPCCTDCCDDLTGNCTIDVGRICEGLAYAAENYLSFESWGTTCQCREGGVDEHSEGEEGFIHLECSDLCRTCNAEGNFCLEKYNYGFELPESTGLDNLYKCNMQYIADEGAPYRNDDILYRIDYLTHECSLSINGKLCNSCLADHKCADGFSGFLVDCSNIEADAVYDDCDQGLNGGELLQFLRPEYFEQECPPCIS